MSTLSDKEKQEVSLLLPWYANGTLSDEDSRKVEAALAQDAELAREFDLVLEDQAAMVELVSEDDVPISMPERFKAALNAQADEPEISVRHNDTGESLFSRMASVLFPTRQRAYAFAAAAFVLLVPAFVILSGAIGNQQPGQYKTASGEEETSTSEMRIIVKFNPGVAWADVDAFLKEYRGQVVKGPSADGLYELAFEQTETLVEQLNTETDIFEFVLPGS